MPSGGKSQGLDLSYFIVMQNSKSYGSCDSLFPISLFVSILSSLSLSLCPNCV